MIRVMIADDNQVFVKKLNHYFSSQPDMNVIAQADDGQAVLEQLAKLREPPDVIVLDIVMPHLDGLAVLERLQQDHTQLPFYVIVCTALGKHYVTNKAMELGVHFVLLKPVDLNILGTRIRHLLNYPELSQSNIFTSDLKKGKSSSESRSLHRNNPSPLDMQMLTLLKEFSISPHTRAISISAKPFIYYIRRESY